MKTRNLIARSATLLLLSTPICQFANCPAHAQGKSNLCQGREVNLAGQPFTGTAHLTFTLYSAALDGSLQPAIQPLEKPTVPVVNGLFSIELDFGTGAFDGSGRWLEVRDAGLNITFPRKHIVHITLKVGQSYIAIEADGIKIDPMGTIELHGAGAVAVKSQAQASLDSPQTKVNSDAPTTSKGGLVKLN